MGYRIVDKIIYSLEGDFALQGSGKEVFLRDASLDAQKQWAGLALGKDGSYVPGA